MPTASKNAPQWTVMVAFDLITFAVSIEIEGISNVCFIPYVYDSSTFLGDNYFGAPDYN